MGSDNNLVWCEVRPGNLEKVVLQAQCKWRIEGKCDWEKYQDAVMAEFPGWDAQPGESPNPQSAFSPQLVPLRIVYSQLLIFTLPSPPPLTLWKFIPNDQFTGPLKVSDCSCLVIAQQYY